MINFVDDVNNREIICHEKSTLQVSVKNQILYMIPYVILSVYGGARQLISYPR
ncbi:MAG: hypothetical protein ACTS73_02560 [Arsenophonus sp. NEOnobi-MAG3]